MIPYNPIKDYVLGAFKIGVEPVAMLFAFIVFIVLVKLGLKKQKIKINRRERIIFFLILLFSSLAGGRLWYYLAHWKGLQTIVSLFDIRNPGLVSLGAFIGGAIGIIIYARIRSKKKHLNWRMEFAKIADIIVAPTALAFFIFRFFGCTIRGDILGVPTNLPWCFRWPNGICRHPASVYLALSALLVFIILIVFFRKEKTKKIRFGKRFDGETSLWFLFLYCFNRFWIEFLVSGRNIGAVKHLGLSTVQWFCLVIILVAGFNLFLDYYDLRRLKIRSLKEDREYKRKSGSYVVSGIKNLLERRAR